MGRQVLLADPPHRVLVKKVPGNELAVLASNVIQYSYPPYFLFVKALAPYSEVKRSTYP